MHLTEQTGLSRDSLSYEQVRAVRNKSAKPTKPFRFTCVLGPGCKGIEMNMMIRTNVLRWTSPVRVRIGYGLPETIRNPQDALAYLQHRWPAIYGDRYRRAAEACGQAMDGRIAADIARQTFIEACIEARMLDIPEDDLPLAG